MPIMPTNIYLLLDISQKIEMDGAVIAEQLAQLRSNKQIQSVEQIKPKCYRVVYTPQLSNSPYSHQSFAIQVQIPQQYPQAPPSFYFTDKIYHLNIDPRNGELYIPILHEDWSSFLTLSAVFESIGSVLQEPDLNYAVSEQMLNEYRYQPQIYIQRVFETLGANQREGQQVVLQSESFVEDVQAIGVRQTVHGFIRDNPADTGEIHGGRLQLAESMLAEKEEEQAASRKILNIDSNIQEMPIIQISQYQESHKGLAISLKQSLSKMDKSSAIVRQTHLRPSESVLKLQKTQRYEQIELNLKKADDLLSLFMRQCDAMEAIQKSTQNTRMKQLMERKLGEQWQMIEQIVDISSQLKQGLFSELMDKTKALLH